MRSLEAPSFPAPRPAPSTTRPEHLVRDVLVRRDRIRLADAVLHLLAGGSPIAVAPAVEDLRRQQLRLARGVLIDIEHVLRGDRSLDPRGVRRVSALLDDLREGRIAVDDALAVEDRAHEARRLLVPLTVG